MKRILLTLAVLLVGFSFGQSFPYPVDVAIGQRWIGTDEAGWYLSSRTYLPINTEILGIQPYLIPELGIDYNTLQPYAALELTLDGEYATLAAFATYMGGTPRINLEARFCILSDRCND
jgi:hypothetical protein